ncbi:MAG: UxaA family hydrolase [Alphaproteobacteria bacterium]
MPRAIVLHRDDNVATVIDNGADAHSKCQLRGEQSGDVVLGAPIPYGHKVALKDIAAGGEIKKYGLIIGRATAPIPAGQHVHVHNVESLRGRGDVAAQPR